VQHDKTNGTNAGIKVKTENAQSMDHIIKKDLLAKLGVDEKWINARLKDETCGFPKPFKVDGRFHWSKRAIDQWIIKTVMQAYPR